MADLLHEAGQFAGSSLGGDIGADANDRLEAALGIHACRHGQVHLGIMPGEAWADDADDGVFLLVEFEGLSKDVGAGGEVGFPERIADNSYWWRGYTGGSLSRREDAGGVRGGAPRN